MMNKLMDKNQQITLSLLFTLTVAIAVLGLTAEIIFVTSHLELLARQMSVLRFGAILN